MNRKHVTGIALLLALAVVAGMFAVIRTTGIASSNSRAATDALVQARTRQLDRYEAGLRSRIGQINAPPSAGNVQAPLPVSAAPVAQRIVYVRPAPIVRTIHRSHENDNSGSERGNDDQ
jgi:hypothetical protein